MRQAGRSLPEYRAVRGTGSILEAIRQPDVAAEVTLQPVRRYGVDAAILYSDIVVPVAAIGFGVDIRPGVGPVVDQPFTRAADLARLRPLEPDVDLPYVQETVRTLVRELPVPLIGFAGAPFTVASYLVEGRPSRDYARTKALMLGEPALVRPAARPPGRPGPGLAAGPGGGRRLGRAAVRQLGRRPHPRPVPPPRPAPLPQGAGRVGRPRRPPHPLRGGHRGAAGPDGRGRRRRGRRRLAGTPRRGPRTGSGPSGRCRATSTPPSAWPPGRPSKKPPSTSCAATPATPATCSTWATASCPTTDPATLERLVELVHDPPAERLTRRAGREAGRQPAGHPAPRARDREPACWSSAPASPAWPPPTRPSRPAPGSPSSTAPTGRAAAS